MAHPRAGSGSSLALVLLLGAGCGLSATEPTAPTAPPGDPAGTGGSSAGGSAGSPGTGGAAGSKPAPSPATDGGRPPTPSAPDAAASNPTPPPGVAGVTNNGRFFAKDKVVVFLHLGHSNMAGRTDTPPDMRPMYFETHPQLWAYGKGGAWRLAKEPLSGDRLTGNSKAGPGMAILRTALAMAADRQMVSIGRGHDGSIGGWCRNFRKGALLYDFVMAPAMELKGKVTFGAIFAMLGVNEFRLDYANLPRFNECLEGVVKDMRTDLGEPMLPFLLGDWEAGATGDFDPRQPYATTTRAEMREAIGNIPASGLIPSEMLPMSDDHHYDLNGYKLWVERGFEILRSKGNLLPWATTTPKPL